MSRPGKKLSATHHWKNRVTTGVVYNSEFQNKKLLDSRIVNNLKTLHAKSKALYSDVVRCSNVNEKCCKKFHETNVNRKLEKVKYTNNESWLGNSVKKSDKGKHCFTSNVVATGKRVTLRNKNP